jgi:hypothetical protein
MLFTMKSLTTVSVLRDELFTIITMHYNAIDEGSDMYATILREEAPPAVSVSVPVSADS